MSRQVLERGALACSALALYGWTQPSVSEPVIHHDCETTARVSSTESRCLQLAQKPTSNTTPERFTSNPWSDRTRERLPDKMEAVYSDLVVQAQALVDRNQLTQAVDLVAGIPKNSQHYGMAQQLQDDWSRELLRQAASECRQGRVGKALLMLNTIPSQSQLHDRITELRQRWGNQDKLLQQAIALKQRSDWQGVIDTVKALEGAPMYQSLLVQGMLQQAMTQLYKPDAAMLQVAMEDLPTVQPAVAPPETISVSQNQ
ncbi:MAG: hypothetical protein KME45_17435 [Stenomitos rutilans HA7619-LM2]|nr:hypothetical protein [Stenomitos rutilans HA7619-LM2]